MTDSTSSAQARPPGTLSRVLGATLNYGMAAYLPRLLNFFLLPVAFAVLTPNQFGLLEVCVVSAVLLETVSRLSLPGAMARLYIDHEGTPGERDLITTIFWCAGLSSLAIAAASVPILKLVFGHLMTGSTTDLAFLVALAAFVRFAPEVQLRLLQAREQSAVALRVLSFQSVLGAGSRLVALLAFDTEVWMLILSDAVTGSGALILALVMQRQDLVGRIRYEFLWQGLSYGVPLIPYRLGAWLQRFAGQWVLAGLGDLAAVAALAAATRITLPLRLATQAFARAIPPIYFRWRGELESQAALKQIRTVAVSALVLIEFAALGATILGAWLVRFFLDPSYGDAAWVLGAIAATEMTRMAHANLCLELFYSKRTKDLTLLFFLTGAGTVLAILLLARPFGAVGAGLGQLLGGLVNVVLMARWASRDFPSALGVRPWFTLGTAGLGLAAAYGLLHASDRVLLGGGILLLLTWPAVLLLVAGVSPRRFLSALASAARRK